MAGEYVELPRGEASLPSYRSNRLLAGKPVTRDPRVIMGDLDRRRASACNDRFCKTRWPVTDLGSSILWSDSWVSVWTWRKPLNRFIYTMVLYGSHL